MMTHEATEMLVGADEALARLLEGNARFLRGDPGLQRLAGSVRAHLRCGTRRLFIIRVAGNVMSPEVMGSTQCAGTHLGKRLLVVLGHEGCGAVQAAFTRQLSLGLAGLLSYLIGPMPMALQFWPGAVAMIFIATPTATLVSNSGCSAWFAGLLVLRVYLIFAMTLYLLRPQVK